MTAWRDLPDIYLATSYASGSQQDPAYTDDRPSLAEYREDLRRARLTDDERAAEQARSEAIWAAAAAIQDPKEDVA